MIDYDIKSNVWSSPTTFDKIVDGAGENADEILFVLQSHILMLIFSRFDGVHFKSLYEWNRQSNRWTAIATLEV